MDTYFPPDLCDLSLTVDPMKSMTKTLDYLMSPPFPLSLLIFLKFRCTQLPFFCSFFRTNILTVARDCDISFLFHEVRHQRHHLHLPYAGVRRQIDFLWLLLSGRCRLRPFVAWCTLPQSLYVCIPTTEIVIIAPP